MKKFIFNFVEREQHATDLEKFFAACGYPNLYVTLENAYEHLWNVANIRNNSYVFSCYENGAVFFDEKEKTLYFLSDYKEGDSLSDDAIKSKATKYFEHSLTNRGKHTDEWDKSFMRIAIELATHSTCVRKKVACLIVKNRRIVSTGINGAPSGCDHCEDHFENIRITCGIPVAEFRKRIQTPGDPLYVEHGIYSNKFEIHSEQNAIAELSKNEISAIGADIYCTLSPCSNCAKLIIAACGKNARVFYYEEYDRDTSGIDLLRESGIEVIHLENI